VQTPFVGERRLAMASSKRIVTLTVIAEGLFVDDSPSSETVDHYLEHLTDAVNKSAQALSLRSLKGNRVLYCKGGVVA
jgi:hypothetical protein